MVAGIPPDPARYDGIMSVVAGIMQWRRGYVTGV
jgi:hypothetical protein